MNLKKIQLIFALSCIVACSPKIHESFESNSYSISYNTQVFNTNLELSFNSPADIIYTSDRKELKAIIRKNKAFSVSNVLFHGVTRSPEYEFFVTISDSSNINEIANCIKFDTLIGNYNISFIGFAVNDRWENPMKSDLTEMVQSFQLGEGYNTTKPSIFDVVNKYNNSIRFYAALNEIDQFPTFDDNDEWMKLQLELTFASMLGINDNYRSLLHSYEKRFTPKQNIAAIIKESSLQDSTAMGKILTAANDANLIMINENHFYPNHRVFLIELLPKLKQLGYNKLAVEALFPHQDSILNRVNAYPTTESGFYIKEQNFSNLIRLAKELNFEFIEYEFDETDTTKTRELGQATNLYNKTFKIDPNSRVIVLAGIDHVLEEPDSRGKKWMANIFKEKYNIDPITISQTHLNTYRHNITRNYALIDGDMLTDIPLSSIDFHIINNTSLNMSFSRFFEYKNDTDEDLQICLFITDEMKNPEIPFKNIPYYTTIVKSNEEVELPYYGNKIISIFIFNRRGIMTYIETKTPPNIN